VGFAGTLVIHIGGGAPHPAMDRWYLERHVCYSAANGVPITRITLNVHSSLLLLRNGRVCLTDS